LAPIQLVRRMICAIGNKRLLSSTTDVYTSTHMLCPYSNTFIQLGMLILDEFIFLLGNYSVGV